MRVKASAERVRQAALPELTNRLFGKDPDKLTMPFCACSPTMTCSTAVITWILRRNPEVTPDAIAHDLAKAWALFVSDHGPSVTEVAGVTMRLSKLRDKGTAWSHSPVHAATYKEAKESARALAAEKTKGEAMAAGQKAPKPSREKESTMSESQQKDKAERGSWPHLRFESSSVHLHVHTDKSGRAWQKARCTIPSGTKVNGVDVSGFVVDMFAKEFHVQAKLLDRPVVFTANPDRPLTIFKTEGEERRQLKVMPWDLTRGLAASRRAREQERGIEKNEGRENPPLEKQVSPRSPEDRDPRAPEHSELTR